MIKQNLLNLTLLKNQKVASVFIQLTMYSLILSVIIVLFAADDARTAVEGRVGSFLEITLFKTIFLNY